MSKGKVKEYDVDRGYGSIIDSQTGRELTVYANSIVLDEDKAKLLKGQAVEFDIERSRNTFNAVNVAVVDDSEDIQTKGSSQALKSISQQLQERTADKKE